MNGLCRLRDHAPYGNLSSSPVSSVGLQGGIQGGQCHLVHTQGAGQRVRAQPCDKFGLAYDQAGLGTAQELVTAEGDDVCARLHAALHHWLRGQPELGRIQQSA